MKELPESFLLNTHNNQIDLARRFKDYRTSNQSTVAEPSVSDFFTKNGITVFQEKCVIPTDNIMSVNDVMDKGMDGLKVYIERVRFHI
jgi:hypothetical protein